MIRRTIFRLIPLLVVTCATLAWAADSKPTGVVTDNLYTDQLYGFRFEKLENWKFGKIDKDKPGQPERVRFTATQTNYLIPENRKSSQENFNPPQIGLWVDTSSLTADSFALELQSRKSKLKARKILSEDFRMLGSGEFQEQMKIQFDGIDGFRLQFNYKYQAQIHYVANDTYNVIDAVRLGDIYFVKYEGKMFVLFFTCEGSSYRPVSDEVQKMIPNLKLKPVKADAPAPEKG